MVNINDKEGKGTWNVRTLYKAGHLRALTQQLDSY
jgi:hypothetical protein